MVTKININFEEDIYKKYYPLVFSSCRRFLVKKDTLEDAIQSVFLLYIKKEDSISSNLSSWLYWASVNVCKVVNKETLKHAEKNSPLFENTALHNENNANEELFSDLGLVLNKLPAKKRDMLLMRYYDNKSYREIGSFYKSSEDSVQKMIDRTVQFLKSEVKRKESLNSVFFAQFFGLNSTSIATISANKFILQNSLLQQSFIKGVQKMYLISKLKVALVCVCLSLPLAIPLSNYIFAAGEQPIVKNVLGSIKEKIDLEISLYDGDKNNLLKGYEVEFKYKYNNESEKSEKFNSDESGKIIFKATRIGAMNIQIITKDYAIHTHELDLGNVKNEYKANLYKGGRIEIRATNTDNKTVEGLTRTSRHGEHLTQVPLEFDVAKSVYVIPNIPLGAHWLGFKAKGYQESHSYLIRVDSKNVANLEVKMQFARKLYFDLDIKTMPDLINISQTIPKESFRNFYVTIEETIALKNKNNLYEFELGDRNISMLTVYADKYKPQEIKLAPDKDTYKITLVENFTRKLQINNEEGKPVMGAIVSYEDYVGDYSIKNIKKIAVTNEAGVADLTIFNNRGELGFNISHKEYANITESWKFDANVNSLKTIVLTESKNIVGKIRFGEKEVIGAEVQLVRNWEELTMFSEAEGSYYFNNLAIKNDKEYFIKAFHRDYGIAISPAIKFESKTLVVDLNLVKEKSFAMKLVDSKGAPLPNKNIIVRRIFGVNNFSFSILTDEKGEYECYNLVHGSYRIELKDDKLMLNDRMKSNIRIPNTNNNVVLTAEKKYLKKLNVSTSDGGVYKGKLEVNPTTNSSYMNAIIGEDGNYYLEIHNRKEIYKSPFIFDAPGYAIFTMGPFDETKEFPEELNVELTEGENFKVVVVNDQNQPLPFVTVDITYGSSDRRYGTITKQSMPTNEKGEVIFSHLSGKFNVVVNGFDKYAYYKNEFDVSQSKKAVVMLMKGGGLKGYLKVPKDVRIVRVYLKPANISTDLVASGNFEFFKIPSGEYTLEVNNLKNEKWEYKTIPGKIIIENEKIFEINLDEIK